MASLRKKWPLFCLTIKFDILDTDMGSLIKVVTVYNLKKEKNNQRKYTQNSWRGDRIFHQEASSQ